MVPTKKKLWFVDEKIKSFVKSILQVQRTRIEKWELGKDIKGYFEVFRGNRMSMEPVQFTLKKGDIFLMRNDLDSPDFVEIEPLRCFDFVLLLSKKDWWSKIKAHSKKIEWIEHENPGESPNKMGDGGWFFNSETKKHERY